jgi:hypothetical protein
MDGAVASFLSSQFTFSQFTFISSLVDANLATLAALSFKKVEHVARDHFD